jgi:type I restriction enzyme M protein
MLTPLLKQSIDEKWDNCWPVSNLRPVAILDLISYLFFIKKLDELELLNKKIPSAEENQFIYTKEIDDFSWTTFKNKNAPAIHELFTKQYGIIALMKLYSQSQSLYSTFFRQDLLIPPTPRLLSNGIEIINLIESLDRESQGSLVEYLFWKAGTAENSAQFIPEFISRLMVSIASPISTDIIIDPAASTGSLLINALDYSKKNPLSTDDDPKLKGFESNIVQLRLAAMRMMLHGIREPDLQIPVKEAIDERPTLIVSSLLFTSFEGNMVGEDIVAQSANLQKESILLNDILQSLPQGGRAVIMVPENFLKSNLPNVQKLRKEILETTNLQGVIGLPANNKISFPAAGILVFEKRNQCGSTEVWFGKLEKNRKRRTPNDLSKETDEGLSEPVEVKFLLDKWNKRKEEGFQRSGFMISAYDIKANNYNLNYNDYKLIIPAREADDHDYENDEATVISSNKENLHHFYEGTPPLQQRRRTKVLPAVLLILLLIITGGWVYYFNYKGNAIPFIQNGKNSDTASILKIPVANTFQQRKEKESKEPADVSEKVISKKTEKEDVVPVENKPVAASTTPVSDSITPVVTPLYTVIDTAWFHYEPDSARRKKVFLQAREDLVLTPTAEENGFIYVVYINNRGQSTRGWLDKRDLEVLR